MKNCPAGYEKRVNNLQTFLTEHLKVESPANVTVYANADCGFRIVEISISDRTSGCSYQRSSGGIHTLALILACEDFVLEHDTPPHRPEGWTSDIDLFEDAKHSLKEVCEEMLKD